MPNLESARENLCHTTRVYKQTYKVQPKMTVKDLDMAKQESESSISLDSASNEQETKEDKNEVGVKGPEAIETFHEKFKACKSAEEKLGLAIDFMQKTLTQNGVPHFKDFWEVRKLCLPLFKETLHAASRAKLWSNYSELSKQARRLKDILDEQASFAVEQIQIAIESLKKDLDSKEEQIQQSPDLVIPCEFLKTKSDFYNQRQKELKLLNAYAARINSLRKELIKTDMRIRQKNLFFQNLSNIGESVFPRRKELINSISKAFEEDVEVFIEENFASNNFEGALFHFREEIKALQNTAKLLTLNTHAFSSTRTRLSECWDQIKVIDKERKKQRVQKRIDWKKNEQSVQEKLQEYREKKEKGELCPKAAAKELDNIQVLMRELDLDKESVRSLKTALQKERRALDEQEKLEQKKRQEEINEKRLAQKKAFEDLKKQIQESLEKCTQLELKEVEEKKQEIFALIEKQSHFQKELKALARSFDQIIQEKKQKSLLALAESDQEALAELKDLLQEQCKEKALIKEQIENYRKICGSSGLDFEKAIESQELLDLEKQKLQKVSQQIELIESKIKEIES